MSAVNDALDAARAAFDAGVPLLRAAVSFARLWCHDTRC
jgi:hypothetical protein